MADSSKQPAKVPPTGTASPTMRRKATEEIKKGEDPLSISKATELARPTDEVDSRHKGSPLSSRRRSGAVGKRPEREEEASTIGGGERAGGKDSSSKRGSVGDGTIISSSSLQPQTVMNGKLHVVALSVSKSGCIGVGWRECCFHLTPATNCYELTIS